MKHYSGSVSASRIIIVMLVLVNGIILEVAYTTNEIWYWGLLITIPLLAIAIYDVRQKLKLSQGTQRDMPRFYRIQKHLRTRKPVNKQHSTHN